MFSQSYHAACTIYLEKYKIQSHIKNLFSGKYLKTPILHMHKIYTLILQRYTNKDDAGRIGTQDNSFPSFRYRKGKYLVELFKNHIINHVFQQNLLAMGLRVFV